MSLACVIGESDPFVAQLLQRFAQESGLQAWRATLGQDLVGLTLQVRPDVIIVDPELPGTLRGWEAAQVLKNRFETRDIPVIACSWLLETEIQVLLGHARSHLHKPELHFRDFVAALQAAGLAIAAAPQLVGGDKTTESPGVERLP
jgi:CheY-like chemotaxis protein